MSSAYISDIIIKKPKYELEQKKTLNWLIEAHTYAESVLKNTSIHDFDIQQFKQKIEQTMTKVGCKPDQISSRGSCIADYLHTRFDQMKVFNLKESSNGQTLTQRLAVFETITDEVFDHFYPETKNPPDEIIHVTCTGYVAPSSAQKIASKRRWADQTRITHAYHMGCYGSIPATRMAIGSLYSPFHKGSKQVDIVHTEVCSLHTNPINHQPDQLVAQSLFSDGFIKYSIFPNLITPSLQILAHKEALIENSAQSMLWNLSDFGFSIFLAKEIPVFISRNIGSFVFDLLQRADLDINDQKHCYFAIHPGGPKIVQQIQKVLALTDPQVQATKRILKNHGNMSSATLPHIWEHILQSPEYPNGSFIVSLAFGPGLSMNGVILQKKS